MNRQVSGWINKGKVVAVRSGLIYARVPSVACGDACTVTRRDKSELVCQVVSFQDGLSTLSPLGSSKGVYPGAPVLVASGEFTITIPANPLGVVMDCFGRVLHSYDGEVASRGLKSLRLYNAPPDPLDRAILSDCFSTGVRSIDGLCTVARGQRIGLFAEAGVGKSTLLGMIARWADVDAIVIGLIGERGREVREFLDECLGEAICKAVVVVATSDEAAARRVVAPYTATTVAEYLRDQGKNVLLLCDSLTRMARAQREIGIASGELPVQKGYPPSVFGDLPQLVERAGLGKTGSITAFYTVLVESERVDSDPLGEEIKSLVDGHIYLSSVIASAGIRPAVNVTRSLSRVFERLANSSHRQSAVRFRRLLARLERDREIAMLGGTPDAELAECLAMEHKLYDYLNQDQFTRSGYKESLNWLMSL